MHKKMMIRAAAIGLALACGAGAAMAADEKCSLNMFEMPVRMVGTRAIVDVGIHGRQVPLLVDSGAFFSFLTPAAAAQLQLEVDPLPWGMRIEGLNGRVEAGKTVVDKMEFQGGVIPEIEFIVGGTEMGAGTMGILGRNFLATSDIEYDLAHGMIRFAYPKGDCSHMGFAYWAGDKPVVELPLLRDDQRAKRPAAIAIAELNGHKVRALFDTGASSSLLFRSAALRVGIDKAQMTPAGKAYGAGSARVEAWSAPLERFALGGEQVSNIRIRVADYEQREQEMLLGMDFFLAHRIYISKSQRRMYFTHNGGPIFALSAQEIAKARAAAGPASAAASAGTDEELPDAAAYARRGAARASRQDYEGALADLDRACAMAPDMIEPLLRRASVHRAQRHRALALQDYDRVLQLDPQQPEALLNRAGMKASATGEGREAALADLHTLEGVLAPQSALRMAMAQLYGRMELPREAIAQWTPWIASHPDDALLPQALNARCGSRLRLGVELDAALDDCNKAVRADGDNAAYRNIRGWLQLRRGDPRRALADFEAALKLKPDDASALYGRGLARQGLGERELGLADLDAARQKRPKIDEEAARLGLAAPRS